MLGECCRLSYRSGSYRTALRGKWIGSIGWPTGGGFLMPDFRLQGQRALVTGGSRGIGLGLARGLAEAGANLVLTARNPGELATAQRELSVLGVEVQVAPFDMTQTADIADYYADVVHRIGPID